ncbi:P-loop containing nucleoside triphosphate hydrolase protein [Flagelloscypha sp. PMI_526]|nr:P-loop containing nucleoside triphosphate hydrolase protein [Flagelloscypha sp. PMI_526]
MSSFATLQPRDDDLLSDTIPSNIPSRQISRAQSVVEDGEGSDVESEGDDELISDDDPMDGGKGKGKAKPKGAGRRGRKSEARKALEAELDEKRAEMKKNKQVDAVKRYSYLLGQTELFRHFVDMKKARDPEYAAWIDTQPKPKGRGRKKKNANADGAPSRHRKSEKEEDEQMLKDAEHELNDDEPVTFEESPPFIDGLMRPYQVAGLNWMIGLHHNGLNGILADEMGLGKTLQTISFLAYLKHVKDIPGPHLIVVPKSTLQNWAREVARWAPDFKAVLLTGNKEERAEIIATQILSPDADWEILITSYEVCLIEKGSLKKLSFEEIVIDEAHRIKNVDSILSQIVRMFTTRGRLLITGTPLQNSMKELWALLNFICPEVFDDFDDLDKFLNKDSAPASGQTSEAPSKVPTPAPDGDVEMKEETESEEKPKEEEEPLINVETGKPETVEERKSRLVVEALHKILRPFLLRRVKNDVEKALLPKKEINIYVGLTEMQRKWYRSVLQKDIDAVNGLTGKKEGKTRLMNMVMQLRKVTCHPYLFDGAEPGPPYTTDEHLVNNCGKMIILDKLLKSMQEKGSRVLIFSQMSRVLDILEDYCLFRQYQYCRIDGGTAHDERISAIDEYNRPGSSKFIFLLTTRAGGLGINLTSADIVVLYDSDWNPQADLQAMDRAHRIGQTKQVYVFRFITEDSVEERMLERAAQKLRLDQLVIQQGRGGDSKSKSKIAADKDELLNMITAGAEKIVNSTDDLLINDDIEAIIQRGEERTQEMNQKYEGLNFEDLANFKSDASVQQWDGEDFRPGKKGLNFNMLSLSKRERKTNYSVDTYFKDTLRAGAPGKNPLDKGPKIPKAPKQLQVQDFQFFPPELLVLQERELAVHKRVNGFGAVLREPGEGETEEMCKEEWKKEQDAIDNAEPLNEEESAYKEQLIEQGFPNWSRRDFQQFIKGLEAYGWDQPFDVYAADIQDKTADEVKDYYVVFKKRWKSLSEASRIEQRINEGLAKRNKRSNLETLLERKLKSVQHPMQELELNYPATKGKVYSEEEDRYLLTRLNMYGMDSDNVYEKIKKDILEFPVFRFDWFFKSRSPQELQRRCNTLPCVLRDAEEEAAETKKPSGRSVSAVAPRGKKRNLDGEGSASKKEGTPVSTTAATAGPSRTKKRRTAG